MNGLPLYEWWRCAFQSSKHVWMGTKMYVMKTEKLYVKMLFICCWRIVGDQESQNSNKYTIVLCFFVIDRKELFCGIPPSWKFCKFSFEYTKRQWGRLRNLYLRSRGSVFWELWNKTRQRHCCRYENNLYLSQVPNYHWKLIFKKFNLFGFSGSDPALQPFWELLFLWLVINWFLIQAVNREAGSTEFLIRIIIMFYYLSGINRPCINC